MHVQLIFFYFPSSIPFYKESYFTRLVKFVPLKFEVEINRRDLHLTIFRIMFINLKKSVYRITWKSFGLENTHDARLRKRLACIDQYIRVSHVFARFSCGPIPRFLAQVNTSIHIAECQRQRQTILD